MTQQAAGWPPPPAAGAAAITTGKIIGPYYTPHVLSRGAWSLNAGSPALGDLVCFPRVLETGVLDRLAQQNAGTPTASELLRMGIYNDDGTGRPGTLLLDAGTIDLSAAVGIKTLTISQAVTRGLYWFGVVRQGPTAVTQLVCGSYGNQGEPYAVSPTTPASPSNLYGYGPLAIQSGVTGALPSNFTLGSWGPANGGTVATPFFRYGS